ncbi:hypothetical protein OK074_8933 [Actinobacteria bacterium OK074]|nr:hypothetical protein OK074_8933 [Actinobacteria bacterium OK074]
MSTVVIIVLIVIGGVLLCALAAIAGTNILPRRGSGAREGRELKRRFGPEYDRAVAHHDGDAKAAERDLAERVKRHGPLHERPLEQETRDRYEARWAAAQAGFVDSPREAVTAVDRLVAELAHDRGFPDGGQYEEQLAALSVHHAHRVHGYRRLHGAARAAAANGAPSNGDGTEDMRQALLAARALFEELLDGKADGKADHKSDQDTAREPVAVGAGADGGSLTSRVRAHLPAALNKRQTKGS